MKKVLLAGVVGGIILFIWGALAWTVLPLHSNSIFTMANEDSVVAVMKSAMNNHAVYMFPGRPLVMSDKAAEDAWTKKFAQGPIGMVIYNPAGSSPMMPLEMALGLVDAILTCMLAAWLLSRSTAARSGYFARVAYCGMLGLFISLAVHVLNWNWMGYPLDYTTGLIADTMVGWVLAGAAIAIVVKAKT